MHFPHLLVTALFLSAFIHRLSLTHTPSSFIVFLLSLSWPLVSIHYRLSSVLTPVLLSTPALVHVPHTATTFASSPFSSSTATSNLIGPSNFCLCTLTFVLSSIRSIQLPCVISLHPVILTSSASSKPGSRPGSHAPWPCPRHYFISAGCSFSR